MLSADNEDRGSPRPEGRTNGKRQDDFVDADMPQEDIERLIEERLRTATRLSEEECIFCPLKSESFEQYL